MQPQPLNTDITTRTRPPTILVEGKSIIVGRTAVNRRHETMVVFYWDQPFQPKLVLVETVEVSKEHIFNRSWLTCGCDWT